MEAHWIKSNGFVNFRNLSEQQLVDCAGDFDNNGCNGGLPSHAFEYIKEHGIATEESYAYTAKDGQCYFDNAIGSVGTVGGAVNLT